MMTMLTRGTMHDPISLDEKAKRVALELLRTRKVEASEPAAPSSAPSSAPIRQRPDVGPDYRRASLFLRWFDGLLRVHEATAHALAGETLTRTLDDEATSLPANDDLTTALASVHRMLMAHPVATKSVYRALLLEGRSHGRTEEGAALRKRLSQSPEIRRASMLWRTLSLDMFDDDGDGALPSTYIDHLLRVVDLSNPASVLGVLFLDEQSPR